MNIGSSDVLVAISFPRYANDVVTLAHYARDRGAQVVAITDSKSPPQGAEYGDIQQPRGDAPRGGEYTRHDSMASPLVPSAHTVLLALALHPVLSSSSAAAVVVIEALVTSLMVSGHGHVRQAEKLTEAISAYLYDEKKAGAAGPRELGKRAAPRSRR